MFIHIKQMVINKKIVFLVLIWCENVNIALENTNILSDSNATGMPLHAVIRGIWLIRTSLNYLPVTLIYYSASSTVSVSGSRTRSERDWLNSSAFDVDSW